MIYNNTVSIRIHFYQQEIPGTSGTRRDDQHPGAERHVEVSGGTIAWFGAFRRLVVRYERSTRMFLAFLICRSAHCTAKVMKPVLAACGDPRVWIRVQLLSARPSLTRSDDIGSVLPSKACNKPRFDRVDVREHPTKFEALFGVQSASSKIVHLRANPALQLTTGLPDVLYQWE